MVVRQVLGGGCDCDVDYDGDDSGGVGTIDGLYLILIPLLMHITKKWGLFRFIHHEQKTLGALM